MDDVLWVDGERERIEADRKILYGYQKRFISDRSPYRRKRKSRQIGYTFECAVDWYLKALNEKRNGLFISAKLRLLSLKSILKRFVGLMELPARNKVDEIILPNGSVWKSLPCTSNTIRGYPAHDIYGEMR